MSEIFFIRLPFFIIQLLISALESYIVSIQKLRYKRTSVSLKS